MTATALIGVFATVCAAGIVLSLFLPSRYAPQLVVWAGSLASLALIALGADALLQAQPLTIPLWNVPAVGRILVTADPVAGAFLLVTGLVFLAGSIYAASGLGAVLTGYSGRAYAMLHLGLEVAAAWVLLAGDVFSFLVAWEIMSILSYLLVTFEHREEDRPRAAYVMLAASEAGALAAALGLLLLAASAGSTAFADLRAAGAGLGGGLRLATFLLTFFGFGVKAGLVPVNVWLKDAYRAAPGPFVPILAGATLNLGLYGIFRVNADLAPATSVAPGLVAVGIGTVSALVGILYATTENDLKALLAHSSIENAGIVTAAMGAGFVFTAAGAPVPAAIAFVVALYHAVNHALYKTLLFIAADTVAGRAGTRDLDRLGGLIRRMPWTAAAVLAGVLSIAALPPFNGFVSEWLTLQTFLRSAELPSLGVKVAFALCGAGLALTAALAVTCFAKLFAMGFLGIARSPQAASATEASGSALAPMALLAVVCLALGVLPTYAIGALDHAVAPLAHASAADALVPPFFVGAAGHAALPPAFVSDFHALGAQVGQHLLPGPGLVLLHRGGASNPVVFAAAPSYLVLVLLGLLGLAFLLTRLPRRAVARRPAWDGGIRRLLPEMTYTATGFSNPVRVIFDAVFRPTTVEDTRATVSEHFRTAIRHDVASEHVVERVVMRPMRAGLQRLARTLARMHHGRLNAYVAYALLCLVVALAASMLVR